MDRNQVIEDAFLCGIPLSLYNAKSTCICGSRVGLNMSVNHGLRSYPDCTSECRAQNQDTDKYPLPTQLKGLVSHEDWVLYVKEHKV